jgi:hypothetical protein
MKIPYHGKVVHCEKEPYDVYIGRGSIWGNKFEIGKDGNRDTVIKKYKEYILNKPSLLKRVNELYGKTLGCYCAPLPCHGDVLIKLAERK